MKKSLKFFIIAVVSIFIAFIIFYFGKSFFETKIDFTTDAQCVVDGCNGEVCHEEGDGLGASICIALPFNACYDNAICERQILGACGWTQTQELKECLGKALKRF